MEILTTTYLKFLTIVEQPIFMNAQVHYHFYPQSISQLVLQIIFFSLIDNILVNNLISFQSRVLSYDISDHMPIFLVYKSIFSQNEQLSETVKFRKTFPNSSNNLLNKFRQIFFFVLIMRIQSKLNLYLLKINKNLGLTIQLRKLLNNVQYYTCYSNKIRLHR